MSIEELFSLMGKQESRFAGMYRDMAARFRLSESEMWIYYFLLMQPSGLTQQDICSQMSIKKQTVNSAVAKLVMEEMVTLAPVSEGSKSKILSLTTKGREFAECTVGRMLKAELRAAQKFGIRKLERLCKLQEEYFLTLRKELGILNIKH